MSISESSPSSWLVLAAGFSGSIAAAFLLRAIKRSFSPRIECSLSCKCGKVKGEITAKREDSIRIWCFCSDCRRYANYVASQGKHPEETIGPYGDNRVVQVCKSDFHITEGQELLQLSRKGSTPPKGAIYMHRYYTKCCHVPICNTVDFLGFTGVFLSNLDPVEQEKFAEPVAMFREEGFDSPEPLKSLHDIVVPDFLWKLLRYHWYRKMGPFDYDMQPTYWGGEEIDKNIKEESKKDS